MIFWNAHGDMFHENVPVEWIDRCFAAMALTPQHTHQVLTKRAARMREYLSDGSARHRVATIVLSMMNNEAVGYAKGFAALQDRPRDEDPETVAWPLPNVWLGVSVEDQARADERIPDLLSTPAAVRWISAEPLLGPVDFGSLPMPSGMGICDCDEHRPTFDALNGTVYCAGCCEGPERFDTGIDWVVVGGESGPSARPMRPTWARSLRDQCAAAGVPFLFKQWGEWVNEEQSPADAVFPGEGQDPFATGEYWARLGKKAAGRLLDGVQHDGYPEVAHG